MNIISTPGSNIPPSNDFVYKSLNQYVARIKLFCLIILMSGPSLKSNAEHGPGLKTPEADSASNSPIPIGSRLELFIDNYLIEKLTGDIELRLQKPVAQEIVMTHDQPWEGSGCGYKSIFKDGNKYKMFYESWHHEASEDGSIPYHPPFCAYAESDDGINWKKPNLGLHDFNGSKNNNIVVPSGLMNGYNIDAAHCAVFKDTNPNVSRDAIYKGIFTINRGDSRGFELIALKSADGINWALLTEEPILTDGAFDSQNLAFWDSGKKEYRIYWRIFSKEHIRSIRTAVSRDFINWEKHEDLTYIDSPEESLYTNQIKPYERAPHIFIGFPARYVDRGLSRSMELLPEYDKRLSRIKKSVKGVPSDSDTRFGTVLTEGLLMSSRDGVKFNRWNEAFLRPGIGRKGSWTYGDNFIAWHVVETKSSFENSPNELSIYASENYWKGAASKVRRYTLRLDGFVSVNTSAKGGELLTKPLLFKGRNLHLNFSTSAIGAIQIEILDLNGKPVNGFSMEDCAPAFGDSVDYTVGWGDNTDVSSLIDTPVRLRIKMNDADLYSIQFK